MYVCMYVYIYIYVCMYVYIYMYVCMYVYICMYIYIFVGVSINGGTPKLSSFKIAKLHQNASKCINFLNFLFRWVSSQHGFVLDHSLVQSIKMIQDEECPLHFGGTEAETHMEVS